MIFGILALVVLVAVVAGVAVARRRTSAAEALRRAAATRQIERSAPPARIPAPERAANASRDASTPIDAPQSAHASPANGIAGAAIKRPGPGDRAQPPIVLIVDDSPIVRRTLEALFQKAGYRTASVDSGEAAVAWARGNGLPPLVTLDMEMPGMNGIDTLRALHELAGRRPVPAVFITSKSHDRVREVAEPLGAIAFFSKPYSNADLLAAAQRAAPLPTAV